MEPAFFHPLVHAWFAETYAEPTPVQKEAWPLIARGEHVLALAPTGSGKTLTAFLSAISRFAEGTYPADKLSVLYVSPLKALNEDIRRNLALPLEGIRARFEKAGESFPDIRIASRSGDTPQGERRRFLLRPPSILALTPESLAIILLNPRGREVLSSVRCLILDEIHASLGTRRGSFLSCQVDLLSLAAGEFQRVALSATVEPPETAAAFVGGLRRLPAGGFEKRQVRVAAPVSDKKIEMTVEFPSLPVEEEKAETIRYGKRYKALVNYIAGRIRANRIGGRRGTVLVFTDSRRRAERISYLINQTVRDQAAREQGLSEDPWAFTHHGSLSREVRRTVEQKLADGSLPCVVATSSLELGIDIGSVDEVILAGSPASSAQALQRVGRSGHGVGLTSRAALLPFNGLDLVSAAALAGAVAVREIEPSEVIENPLDILAQLILALCAEKERNEDELYELIRGFYVYRNLSRAVCDGVVRMLAGGYEGTRLTELKRRIYRDRETKTLTAAPGVLLLLYTSGGVITSRGSYSLRLAPNTGGGGAKIGELDEEFVWERRLGDSFDFGGRSWKITAIGPEAVEVIPLPLGADFSPFWKAEAAFRSPLLSRRILALFEEANAALPLKSPDKIPGFSLEAKDELDAFLLSQKSVQGEIPLSGPLFIPIEIVDDREGRGDAWLAVLHTFRGGAINYPLSMALAAELEAGFSPKESSPIDSPFRIPAIPDDNAVLLRIPRSLGVDPALITVRALKSLGEGGKAEKRLKERIESSGIFGAAFREAAERSLVLPRPPFGKRVPLWVTRQRSKRLFHAVSPYGDFPVSAEAWRTVLEDQFDMEGFRSLTEDIHDGVVSLACFTSFRPSPFARNLAWAETNVLMYEYDEKPGAGLSLSDEAIAEALGKARLRPSLQRDLVEDFTGRLRREIPGWVPDNALSLSEWVKERIAIPSNGKDEEWEKLTEALPEELRDTDQYKNRLVLIKRPGAAAPSWVHREWAEVWEKGSPEQLASECLAPWLRCQGPLPLFRIREVFGFSQAQAQAAVDALEESGKLVKDVSVEGLSSGLVCDRDNMEFLLRLSRRKRRPKIRERPLRCLIPYLALRQGITARGDSGEPSEPGEKPWEKLAGFPVPIRLWETEIFPARLGSYRGSMLDKEIGETRLLWYGAGREKAAFCTIEDLDLVLPLQNVRPFQDKLAPSFFDTPRSFWEIRDALGLDNRSCAEALWQTVWKGLLSADSWEPLRRAIEEGFSPSPGIEEIAARGRLPRALRERWRLGPPVRGNWFSLVSEAPWEPEGRDSAREPDPWGLNPWDLNPLEEEELKRGRVRLLLKRWGILCRPLLEREVPSFSWSALLPAMRLMELAGELVAGRFFSGFNSLQFASPRIGEELEEAEAVDRIFSMNAADPASLSGLQVPQGLPELPARLPSARLCFKGSRLIASSSRSGKSLDILIPPEDSCLIRVAEFAAFPRRRAMHPEKKILIEKINGKTAALGEYAAAFKEAGFVNDRGRLVLWQV